MDQINLIKYTDILFKTAVNKCRDIDLAEDLVQETLLAALAYASKGKEIEKPYQWLVTVLNNKYYDWLRQKYSKPVIIYNDLSQESPDDFDNLHGILATEASEEIRKELAYLSRIYRQVMVRYYMKGESITLIAKDLGIPEGTVKSRLDTGRKLVKKGVDTLVSYTKQSYEPDILYISCSGERGLNDEPFSIVSGDKIAENILILAYSKPITEIELSKLLGIPAAYIEPIIKKLIDGELIKRMPNGKIYTDFIIYTESDRSATLDKQESITTQYFELFWTPLSKGLDELEQQEFYIKQSKSKKQKLRNHFCVNTLLRATINVRDEVTGHMPYSEYPCRKDGGRWIASGYMYPGNYKHENNPYSKFLISGEAKTARSNYQNTTYICLSEYDTLLGKTPIREINMSPDKILELLFSIYQGENSETAPINAFYFDNIPILEKQGIVARNDGKAVLDIPVLTSREYHSLMELSQKYQQLVSKNVRDILIGVFEEGTVKLPEHLTSVPKWQRYAFCGSFVPMMVMLQAKEMGFYQIESQHPSPVVILIVDKLL